MFIAVVSALKTYSSVLTLIFDAGSYIALISKKTCFSGSKKIIVSLVESRCKSDQREGRFYL